MIKGKFIRDFRYAGIGKNNAVPDPRDRPLWPEWSIKLRILFNKKTLSEEQMVNLAMHAGQYVGLCEMRAEKKQGECGGFVVG